MYVELHAHSAFSFLDGASTPTELAAAAAAHGYPAFALTDHDGVWGSMEFAHACKGVGVRPIAGAELTVGVGPAGPVSDTAPPRKGGGPASSPPTALAARAAVLAAFVALLVHTLAYAGFFEDPITWVLLAVGASLAHAAAGDDPMIRRPA